MIVGMHTIKIMTDCSREYALEFAGMGSIKWLLSKAKCRENYYVYIGMTISDTAQGRLGHGSRSFL